MYRDKTEFSILKAFNGDSILVKTFTSKNEGFVILIDGGTSATFEYSLKKQLEIISKIDLLILTHIDSDHIGGLIKFFKSSLIDKIEISEIWINHPELIDVNSGELISFNQVETLKNLISNKKSKTKITNITTETREKEFDKIKFTILSPTNEILELLYKNWPLIKPKLDTENSNISSDHNVDVYNIELEALSKTDFKPNATIENDLINASSISFILNCIDKSFLFLADSRAEIIEKELKIIGYNQANALHCDYVKVSHHGSKNNTSKDLLEIINSKNYIVSTNGGSSNHKHPSREIISRILFNNSRNHAEKINIFTNYPIDDIKKKIGNFISEKDLEKGNWNIEQKNNF